MLQQMPSWLEAELERRSKGRYDHDEQTRHYVTYCTTHEKAGALDIVLTDRCTARCVIPSLDQSYDRQPAELAQAALDSFLSPVVNSSKVEVIGSIYQPIQDWQTRIAILHAGSGVDALAVELVTADLIHKSGVALHGNNQRKEYEALSYCWGSNMMGRMIQCNGQPFHVTTNLFAALLRLRHDAQPKYLWIDAICINQADTEERAMQVSNMLLIYKKASEVIVWLGECNTHDMEVALNLLTSMPDTNYNNVRIHSSSDFQHTCMPILGATKVQGSCQGGTKRLEDGPQKMHICLEHSQNLIDGLTTLFNAPWHRRIWVRQEVWVARNIIVLCGRYRIYDWDRFQAAADLVDRLRHWHPWYWRDGKPASTLGPRTVDSTASSRASAETLSRLDLRLDVANPTLLDNAEHELDLFNALRRTADCKFSDVHDRIYAVLGMTRTMRYAAPDARRLDVYGPKCLVVDYTLPVSELFEQVAKYFVHRDESLAILCLAAQYGGEDDGNPLPSWVPDWRTLSTKGVYRHWLSVPRSRQDPSIQSWSKLREVGLAVEGRQRGLISFCWCPDRDDSADLHLKIEVVNPPGPESTYLLARPSRILPVSGDIVVSIQGISGVCAVLRPRNGESWTFVAMIIQEDEARNTGNRDYRERQHSTASSTARETGQRWQPRTFILA